MNDTSGAWATNVHLFSANGVTDMKVLLINPETSYEPGLGGGTNLPLGLLAVADSVKAFADVSIVDISGLGLTKEIVLNKITEAKPDVIGITCWMNTLPYVQWLSVAVHEAIPSTPIVFGGPFATVAPELYLNHARIDWVVIGEGEVTFPDLLFAIEAGEPIRSVAGIAYRENGAVKYSPPREPLDSLDIGTSPYELLPMERYLQSPFGGFPGRRGTIVMTSRGCPYNCSFCNQNYLGPYRERDISEVEAEIQTLRDEYGANLIYLGDATFTIDRERAIKIGRIMATSGLEWYAQTRVDHIFGDMELLSKLAESGCKELRLGLENADQYILNNNEKGISVEDIESVIKQMRCVGIEPVVFVLFGLPSETEETVKATLDFVKTNNVKAIPNILFPIPNTGIWEYLETSNEVLPVSELVTRFSENYCQLNRAYVTVNLSDTSDEVLINAVRKIWQSNKKRT